MTNLEIQDAFDVIAFQDDVISRLALAWRDAERRLGEKGGTDPLSDRRSAINMLLMHMEVSEGTRATIALRLREIGNIGVAEALEHDGPRRRAAIKQLEGQLRRLWAIDPCSRELIETAENVADVWRGEAGRERNLVSAAPDLDPLPSDPRRVLEDAHLRRGASAT